MIELISSIDISSSISMTLMFAPPWRGPERAAIAAQMLAIEFEDLHRTDLNDKLDALFGGLPPKAFEMVPLFLHIALDIFMMRAVPNKNEGA